MPVVVKKYENRRLYDTAGSRYVNLEELAAMIAGGADISVVDVKTGKDLTREVLLQVVVEGDPTALPVPLLRRIIRARGDSASARLVREQLVLGLELLEGQLAHAEDWIAQLEDPLPEGESPAWAAVEATEAAWQAPGHGQAELEALRGELSRLEARLGRRG